MTHAGWVAERAGEAPAALLERLYGLFAEHPHWEALPRVDAFLEASEHLLVCVLSADAGAARTSALDLLAADACVTYAFEAAADDPRTLSARAAGMQHRVAALGAARAQTH